MSYAVTQLGTDDLGDVLALFDAVQSWLVHRGLKEQWGDLPFSKSESQRERFGAWLGAGRMVGVRVERQVIGTLVFSLSPPEYAEKATRGQPVGGYLEAFAVHRDYAGRGVGAALLGWAEQEASSRDLPTLCLDCWAENAALRAYYRRAGFAEAAPLALGAWRGVLFQKSLRALPLSPVRPPAKT